MPEWISLGEGISQSKSTNFYESPVDHSTRRGRMSFDLMIILLYYIILYFILLYYIILYYIILYYIILYYIILY